MWILKSDTESDPLTFRVRDGGVKTIGRATRADFIVDAPLVSRLHCRLEADAHQIEVVDLASTNGTFVNGKRIRRASLQEGDRLRVGRVELSVKRQTNAARS